MVLFKSNSLNWRINVSFGEELKKISSNKGNKNEDNSVEKVFYVRKKQGLRVKKIKLI